MSLMYWLILAAILIVEEIISMGLTTIWFAGGALLAGLASYLGAHWVLQILLFAGASLLMFFFTRPVVAKHLIKDVEKTNADALVGKVGIVEETIDNLQGSGVVKINGMQWTARTVDDTVVQNGQRVVVEEISGVKLMVKKEEK